MDEVEKLNEIEKIEDVNFAKQKTNKFKKSLHTPQGVNLKDSGFFVQFVMQ